MQEGLASVATSTGGWTMFLEKPDDADRIYNALIDGGSIQMPIQETFWAKRFAMLTDRYGIPWMINC